MLAASVGFSIRRSYGFQDKVCSDLMVPEKSRFISMKHLAFGMVPKACFPARQLMGAAVQYIIKKGQKIEKNGMAFHCIGLKPYEKEDRTIVALAVLQTECATCGVTFEFRVPTVGKRLNIQIRCAKHKHLGTRVPKRILARTRAK